MPRTPIILALTLVGLLASACTWSGWAPKEKVETPENAPRPLQMLTLGVPHEDFLDCPQHDCNHWYRVDVDGLGVLRVDLVQADDEKDENLTRVVIRGEGSKTLGQGVGIHGEPLVVESAVGPGMYGVLVQGGGVARPYTVTISFEEKQGYPDATAEPVPSGFDVQ